METCSAPTALNAAMISRKPLTSGSVHRSSCLKYASLAYFSRYGWSSVVMLLVSRQETDKSEMNLDKSRRFHYIKLANEDRRYFCLQQNVAVLAWILFFKNNILRSIIRSESKKLSLRLVIRWLQKKYRFFRRNLIFLIRFARYKYKFRRIDSVVTLPSYGQICVAVHKGYKIFDFRRGVVAKVFDHDVNMFSIFSEIDGLKKVSPFDFAPSLKRWNAAERWYEEDYVSGSLDSSYKPLDSATLLQRFSLDLVQHINSLILFQQPIIKNSLKYVREIIKNLEDNRLSKQDLTLKDFNTIKTFIDLIVERLRVEGNCPVFLVFTHGDFCPANMLNTRHGIKIIDWEGAGNRSVLFDVYSYFFYRPVNRKVPLAIMASELNEALPIFISNLDEKAPHISSSLLQRKNVYRWIFYIEQICKEVERVATDKNLNILDEIFRSMEAFACYENTLTGAQGFPGGEIDNFLAG